MAKSSWSHAMVWVSLAGALAGCGTVPDSQRPASPLADAEPPSRELVPQVEPPSRTGNADTYVVFGRRYRVKETSAGYRERGTASWYGWEFHGRKTSSGPPFNMFDLTAAHKSLPLPTYVRVTNLDNGLSAIVKVTDRGPFVGTRLIDLSYAAADRLGMLDRGTAPVEIVALEPYQFLPKLAAYRAEQRELLASRAARAQPKMEIAEIEFARAAPIRPSAQSPGLPPARLARADAEPRNAPPTVVKPANVKLARADVERNPTPMRTAPRVASTLERNAPPTMARTPMRLALANVERNAAPPAMMTKTMSVKPAKAEDNRKPAQGNIRPSSVTPAAKGREAAAKPAVPAANANRPSKPAPRQANESKPAPVRLASLKVNRSRGVVD
ncbi:MAG: septal ring lytic transglycosylase RlpA family protein [Candidatus Contendobacter sp.]|nr:septal ring lytic transglycosylase RlpA family protein [Candidatus Contendobacter sp.]MDS4060228.1 septal ring lytic transglycosylase RlpA family protein [Candidatus Contendobacter sp.]